MNKFKSWLNKFNAEENSIAAKNPKDGLFILSFDRRPGLSDEEAKEIRKNVLQFIYDNEGKTFMCPVESTLLFLSKKTMGEWCIAAKNAATLKDTYAIIGKIEPPRNDVNFYNNGEIDFYAKSNQVLGAGLLKDLEDFNFLVKDRFKVNATGMIVLR